MLVDYGAFCLLASRYFTHEFHFDIGERGKKTHSRETEKLRPKDIRILLENKTKQNEKGAEPRTWHAIIIMAIIQQKEHGKML